MALAISHAHFTAHTFHMDIKPANFVLDANKDLMFYRKLPINTLPRTHFIGAQECFWSYHSTKSHEGVPNIWDKIAFFYSSALPEKWLELCQANSTFVEKYLKVIRLFLIELSGLVCYLVTVIDDLNRLRAWKSFVFTAQTRLFTSKAAWAMSVRFLAAILVSLLRILVFELCRKKY